MNKKINIPAGWQMRNLGHFMSFKNGVNASKESYGQGIKFVNVMDIFNQKILQKESVLGSVNITEKQLKEYSVEYGDILFNRTSEIPNEIAYSSVYLGNEIITFGGFVIRGRQKNTLLSPSYAQYCFDSYQIRKDIIRKSQGVVRSNIGQKDLNKVTLLIPPLQEQKAIADILEKWDEAIEKTSKLIEAKKKRFEWLVSKMINKSGHSKKQISDFIIEVSVRNKNNKIGRVLSVTNRNGFVLPEDRFDRRIASSDVSNYKIVSRGQYAYNPSRINVGSIARLDNWEEGVLSPMYIVFKLNDKKVDSDYFLHWLSSSEAKQRIRNSAQGSVRESVGFADLGLIPILSSNLEQQKQIAKTLNTAKKEITILEEILANYKNQKKGLMQKLLTGKCRLNLGKEATNV